MMAISHICVASHNILARPPECAVAPPLQMVEATQLSPWLLSPGPPELLPPWPPSSELLPCAWLLPCRPAAPPPASLPPAAPLCCPSSSRPAVQKFSGMNRGLSCNACFQKLSTHGRASSPLQVHECPTCASGTNNICGLQAEIPQFVNEHSPGCASATIVNENCCARQGGHGLVLHQQPVQVQALRPLDARHRLQLSELHPQGMTRRPQP